MLAHSARVHDLLTSNKAENFGFYDDCNFVIKIQFQEILDGCNRVRHVPDKSCYSQYTDTYVRCDFISLFSVSLTTLIFTETCIKVSLLRFNYHSSNILPSAEPVVG